MAEIILLRHGKSDWTADYGPDRDRPLSGRGREAAATMGRVLSLVGREPDLILTSPAVRAHSTARIASTAGAWQAPIEVVDVFYGGGTGGVIQTLRGLPAEVHRVMLVGHEPTWSEVLSVLAGGGDHRMPTGAAAGLERLAAGWPAVSAASCRLLWLLPPRLFTGGGLVPPPSP